MRAPRCENYAGDITRTFPVNGRFSKPQRLIYELVLEAQRLAIDAVRPGRPLERIHQPPSSVLTRAAGASSVCSRAKPRG
jgi:Xaa-Pro aminopeptidase